ncbi:[protein-PII] uridylyltransferase [Algiphilus sp.]|uniref:[protein-PII] uridylyltransferase n=1 Tax=Algiphilus sp. TaxID=1872431 RepID=UPI002A66A9A9|nr:[protein-PII] uridylyltransferase [Pseudomonadota bacterium]
MESPTVAAHAESAFSLESVRRRLQPASGGSSTEIFRDTLRWGADRLQTLFHEGAPADALVEARSMLVDEVLRAAWQAHVGTHSDGLALLAVGGYGRNELLPHSDIDLLVLHSDTGLERHRGELEQFMAMLWDIGLEVGASVRTVADCQSQAREDLSIFTTLTEHRLLAGSPALVDALEAALGPDHVWPSQDFFRAKLKEQQSRHAKFDDTGYKLEPNVKESPGGLRDIQTVAWVAKRHFGAGSLRDLRERGFLSKQECDELYAGQDFLWRVRFALHMLTGRKEDRLLFDHQVRVATLFGYVDADSTLAVEQFMQLYYRNIKMLTCLNDMLLQLFEQAILDNAAAAEPHIINERFCIRSHFIEARRDNVFREQPWALIEIFLQLQRHPEVHGIGASTLRLIRRDRRLVDEGLRETLHARELFIQMFREERGLTRALRRMNRYGVLGRYLPDFGKVIGHMQYDLFHTLTVDEHTLYVVRNLRRMAMQRFRDELPFCHEVMQRVPRRDLLYLGGLFHDIGKGQGGDHSTIGADTAKRFCLNHGLSHADAELVDWLVRNHLLMSLTAQRMDISDPDVVTEFTQKVGSRARLDYLFLLTCADIRATNPKLWNSWRKSLLEELYRATATAFERGIENPQDTAEVVSERRQQALALSGVPATDAESIWSRLDADYFLRYTPEELAWHLPALLQARPDGTLVLVEEVAERGTTVFVYTLDRDRLFAVTTGVLAQLGLSILDARLNTTADGFALDSYVVIEGDGSAIDGSSRREEIQSALCERLQPGTLESVRVSRRASRQLRHFDTPTIVRHYADDTRDRTVIELVSGDRPGLLSLVGEVFADHGVRLDAAKIATIGERAEDLFYVTDATDQPLVDIDAADALCDDIVDRVKAMDDSP